MDDTPTFAGNEDAGGRPMSTRAAAFSATIKHMGADLFSNWLSDSFGQGYPAPVGGYFHYNDDALFGEVFSLVSQEFDEETKLIAALAFEASLDRFDLANASLLGLLELFSATEHLEQCASLKVLLRIVTSHFRSQEHAQKWIFTQDESIDFRDIFESVYRRLMRSLEFNPKGGGAFSGLAAWANQFLKDPMPSRKMVPAYAPLFVLSVYHRHQKSITDLGDLWVVLKSGFHTAEDPFAATYIVPAPDGSGWMYPYNLATLEAVVRKLSAVSTSGSRYQPIARKDNPADRYPSTSSGSNAPLRPIYTAVQRQEFRELVLGT